MESRSLSLLSEIAHLERILSDIPDEDVIDRYTFEQRLFEARAELNSIPSPSRIPEVLKLTFRGSPVVGSHGIVADFAGKASAAFADAFAATVAGLNATLRYMGPIPDRARNPLLITGTVPGSFGFQIELPLDEQDLFASENSASQAIESIRELLRVSVEGTDDQVSDIVVNIHPRAVRKVSDFLTVMSQNDAVCGIEFRDKFFRFKDSEQLAISQNRLREENISEKDEEYFGEFQGVLPHSRTFEFKVSDSDLVIKGKVDPEIGDPDVLNRDWLHKPTNVSFRVVQVGQGRPRFTLLQLKRL